jgi:hypothetical protein
VGDQVAKVTALATVPTQLVEVRRATRTFASDVRSVVVRWIVFVGGALTLAVLVWIVGSVAHIVGETRRGLALMLGRA